MIESAYSVEKRLIDLVVQFYNTKNATITDGDYNKIKAILDTYEAIETEVSDSVEDTKKVAAAASSAKKKPKAKAKVTSK